MRNEENWLHVIRVSMGLPYIVNDLQRVTEPIYPEADHVISPVVKNHDEFHPYVVKVV